MRKVLILLFIFLFFAAMKVHAAAVIVKSLSDVDKNTDKTEFYVLIQKDVKLKNGLVLPKNTLLYSEIIRKVPERYARRNAYLVVKPMALDTDTEIISLEDYNFEAKTMNYKAFSKKDLKKAGVNLGMRAAYNLLPGSEQVLQISKGLLIVEEDKTRLAAVRDNFIESTPLRHLKKGKKLDIENGDRLILRIYSKKN